MDKILGFINALPGAASQGLIYGIMAIGVYITYKILDIADLTVDSSFCTGGAAFVVCFNALGCDTRALIVGLLAALVVGLLAGLVTGLLHTVCGIPAILAGILTQLGLWPVNMALMGILEHKLLSTLSIPLMDDVAVDHLLVSLRFVNDVADGKRLFFRHPIFVVGMLTALIIAVLYWFFGTERGASLRATGTNGAMARAQGINTDVNKVIGLMISNSMVALAGALMAQFKGSAEIKMGQGAIVIGLAAVIIGEVLLDKVFRNFALKLASVSIGAIIYYVVVQAVISLSGIDSNYQKLISAIMVGLFLTIPYWKRKYFRAQVKVAAGGRKAQGEIKIGGDEDA